MPIDGLAVTHQLRRFCYRGIDGVVVITDSEGKFSLATKETGRLRVYPSKNGYIYARPNQKHSPTEAGVWVQLSAGDHVKNLDLRMARPGVISGRVLDANGNPIVGTAGSVALMRYTYRNDGTRELGWVPGIVYPGGAGSFVRMNDRGEFRFYDLPPGEYYLSVSGGGGVVGSSRSYFYPGVTDLANAVPITVSSGDDIKLGILNLPPRDKGVEVRLHNNGEPTPTGSIGRVHLESGFLEVPVRSEQFVLTSFAQGHYDIVVTTESPNPNATHAYASVSLNVGTNVVDQEIMLRPKAKVDGSVVVEDDAGNRTPAPKSVRCQIRSRYGLASCVGSQVVPGLHQFELPGLLPDMYLLSAKVGDRDVLTEELNIKGDTTLDIVLATPGAIVDGIVRTTDGSLLSDAVVVLVPEAPYDKMVVRYRSVITDSNGKYELHGVAPGSYKIYAWPELDGFAYRNAEFMKDFSDRGKPLRVEKQGRASVDLTALENVKSR